LIYEMRTYDLKPRSLPEVLKRFGEGYENTRKKFCKRSINHVLADGQGPCLKPEVYFFGSAMRQGNSAS